MLCGACWVETSSDTTCSACGQPPLLDARYRLEHKLGQGANGVTFAATRIADGLSVCVKGLSFRGMSSFDAERAFHREAAVLRALRHPQVPAYVDDFALGAGPSFTLYLVQELVVGQDLDAERKARRPTATEVFALADELLGIVAHLHALAPPIVHRDIKPGNVMRRSGDGRLVLVDFGSVKDVVGSSLGANLSVQGTFGFMAPEQFRGEASPRSDLYGIGALAIALLSGREPTTMMDASHVIQWRPHVAVAEGLAAWLERMTAHAPEDRFPDAASARAALAALLTSGPSAQQAPQAVVPGPSPRGPELRIDTDLTPEHARKSAHVAFIAAGVAVLILIVGVLVTTTRDEGAVMVQHLTSSDFCKGPCRSLAAPFKEGLSFGMTLAEAKAARADVAKAEPVNGELDASLEEIGIEAPRDDIPRLPSLDTERVCMPGELLGEPARCCLDFHSGLARLSCAATALKFTGIGRETVLPQVQAIYGLPTSTSSDGRTSTWEAPEATLTLTEGFRTTLIHVSAAWRITEAKLEADRQRRLAARRAAEDAERQRQLDAEKKAREGLNLPDDPL